MPYHRANEKFGNAVRALATGPGRIQERLAEAFIYNLTNLKAEDVPEGFVEEVEAMQARVRRDHPRGNEGGIVASTANMRDDEAVEMARAILAIAYQVESLCQESTTPTERKSRR